jgi:hypothetical protein
MSDARYTGGCLCGAVRWQAEGPPAFQGVCFCGDCRKASGSGFIGFMGYPASALAFSGETTLFESPSVKGMAARNSCPTCGGLVFGGIVGKDEQHTVYAGTLDDPSLFKPSIAIFVKDRPAWAPLPQGLVCFEAMPD